MSTLSTVFAAVALIFSHTLAQTINAGPMYSVIFWPTSTSADPTKGSGWQVQEGLGVILQSDVASVSVTKCEGDACFKDHAYLGFWDNEQCNGDARRLVPMAQLQEGRFNMPADFTTKCTAVLSLPGATATGAIQSPTNAPGQPT